MGHDMEITDIDLAEIFSDNTEVYLEEGERGEGEFWWVAKLRNPKMLDKDFTHCWAIGDTIEEAVKTLQERVLEEYFATTDEEQAKMVQAVIPEGDYCYSRDAQGNRVVCPYWAPRPESQNAYCHFLRRTDLTAGLLWDQVKECGINDELEEDELSELEASYLPPRDYVDKKLMGIIEESFNAPHTKLQ